MTRPEMGSQMKSESERDESERDESEKMTRPEMGSQTSDRQISWSMLHSADVWQVTILVDFEFVMENLPCGPLGLDEETGPSPEGGL